MPIHKMNFHDGVFYTMSVGYSDSIDGKMWANALKKYASTSDYPIVALVDMTQVDRLCPTIVKVYEKTMEDANLYGVAIVISDAMLSRNARVIDKLGALPNVKVFTDLDTALSYCDGQLRPALGVMASKYAGLYGGFRPMACAVAVF